jgi:hypothetical protein
MSSDHQALLDFERAFFKGFLRKIITWLTGKSNALLPFDLVKKQLPIKGQHYIGLQQVQVDQIIGSMGRYRDFDRAFLPVQTRTRDRWVNIDKAHYDDVILPPVDLYKMGEVYFVKDGNHRVSVARERGQVYLDAYVTEIDIFVPLTADTDIASLELKRELASFIEQTRLPSLRPSSQIECSLPGEYERLLEHISVHRWYLGEQRNESVPYEDAVVSWYDNIYLPLVGVIRERELLSHFKNRTESDLYLWMIEYLWYRREAHKEVYAFEESARQFTQDTSQWPTDRLVSLLRRATWVDHLILAQEHTGFIARNQLNELRPQLQIELTIPGLYDRLQEHIDVHRWYLGVERGMEVPNEEAILSWCDNVYLPIILIIREQQILVEFPGRTETDLYLWIIEHQAFLKEYYGGEASIEQAIESFTESFAPDPVKKMRQTPKKKPRKR